MQFVDDKTIEWTWTEKATEGKMKFKGTNKRQSWDRRVRRAASALGSLSGPGESFSIRARASHSPTQARRRCHR